MYYLTSCECLELHLRLLFVMIVLKFGCTSNWLTFVCTSISVNVETFMPPIMMFDYHATLDGKEILISSFVTLYFMGVGYLFLVCSDP